MVAAKGKIMINLTAQHKLGILQGFVVEMDISSTMSAGLCGFDSEWQSEGIFEKRNRKPWARRLRAKQKQGASTRTHPAKSHRQE